MQVLEEKITIGESRSHPRELTGEAGGRCGEAREDRETRQKTCSRPNTAGAPARQDMQVLEEKITIGEMEP
jgi:hypothetical protein